MSIINKRKLKNCTDKCGDCKSFSKQKKYEDTCKNLGIIATSKAPTCFEPDLDSFRKISSLPNLEELGKLIKDMSSKQARILAHLLQKQSKMLDRTFYIGQPVYVCLGEEYLSHYFKAFVLDYEENGDYVTIVSKLKNCKAATKLFLKRESLLNQLQFNQKAIELSDSGRIVREPKEFEHFRNLPIADKLSKKGLIDVSKLIRLDLDVVVTTIDNAPKEMLEKKKKIKDLTEIFQDAVEGSSRVKIRKLNIKTKGD